MFGFGNGEIELNPMVALAVSSVYMISADGGLADEEMGAIISMFGGNDEIVENAVKYIEQNDNLEENIAKFNEILNREQKESLLINLLDILLADGEADEKEQTLFFMFANAFGFEQSELEPYFDIISKKNSLGLFQ